MKKFYVKPEIEIVALEMDVYMLTNSADESLPGTSAEIQVVKEMKSMPTATAASGVTSGQRIKSAGRLNQR
jgi:hypothetical protein